MPTFVVGRNPYARLVSGFRDKMVANPGRTDQHTMRDVNTFLGVPEAAPWDDTPAAFRLFVHALWDRGITAINMHFRPAVHVCGGTHRFMHDYYLPLEELQRWFPCLMDGLGLRGWTESGWGDSPSGRMYIGAAEETFVTLRSYLGSADAAPRWDAGAGAATTGVRGVDWDFVRGDQCWWSPPDVSCRDYYASFTTQDGRVVPGGLGGEDGSGGGGRVTDAHVTASGVQWARYYDQATADLVFLLYAIDFETFGYQRFEMGGAG